MNQQPDSAQAKSTVSHPNTIGLAGPGPSGTYGILIEGRDDRGEVPSLIVTTLLRRQVRILSQTARLREKSKEFTLALICDLREANGTPDDLIIQIRKTKHVTFAEALSLKDQLFDGLLFPLLLMETNRVIGIDSGLMFDIQDRLRTEFEKSILEEAGRDYGKRIVKSIKQKFEPAAKETRSPPALNSNTIKENVKGYLKATGWGKFRWESEENLERVVINDAPISSKVGGAAGNLFLHGLVSGVTDEFRNKSFSVMEDHYDPQSRLLTLTLIESRSKSLLSETHKDEFFNERLKALGEVEKIINSIEGVADSKGRLEESKPEQKVPAETVIDIPVTESDTKLHLTLKTKGGGSKLAKESDEHTKPTEKIPDIIRPETKGNSKLPEQSEEQQKEQSVIVAEKSDIGPVQPKETNDGPNEHKITDEKDHTTTVDSATKNSSYAVLTEGTKDEKQAKVSDVTAGRAEPTQSTTDSKSSDQEISTESPNRKRAFPTLHFSDHEDELSTDDTSDDFVSSDTW